MKKKKRNIMESRFKPFLSSQVLEMMCETQKFYNPLIFLQTFSYKPCYENFYFHRVVLCIRMIFFVDNYGHHLIQETVRLGFGFFCFIG